MTIRPERPEDFPQIYELVKRAFETAAVSNGDEQNLVNRLRAGGDYIPDLTLVAEEDGEVIGHIMITHKAINGGSGQFPTLYVAPLSVALEHRKQGVGSRLMHESLRLARELGHKSVVLVGDPAYYHRFGFTTAAQSGIANSNGIPDEYVMVCELIPGALAGLSGVIDF
ncbi:MAG: GNAT family N-acetyltransferase [Bacteroidota bacterium]